MLVLALLVSLVPDVQEESVEMQVEGLEWEAETEEP
jgi:hypothetical protein